MSITVRPCGRQALLAEPEDRDLVLSLAAAARRLPGAVEVVPAARTVLVCAATPTDAGRLADQLAELDSSALRPITFSAGQRQVRLDVVYDGADLPAIAAETGLTADEIAHRHSAANYLVAFCGFAPGFAYLTGLPAELRLPRLAEPRTRVPAGSVGVADEFTGVYPRPSPGGWRLLGHTDAVLWDEQRDPPALLTPGTRVRFRPA